MTEWRRLPEFPKYEITSDGDVRNRDSKYVLKEVHNKTTGAYSYCLWKGSKSYHRNFWGLIYSAWPELRPEPRWRTHPVYTGYEVSRAGQVRNKRTRHVNRPRTLKGQAEPKIRLRIDGQKLDIPVTTLVAATYPHTEES